MLRYLFLMMTLILSGCGAFSEYNLEIRNKELGFAEPIYLNSKLFNHKRKSRFVNQPSILIRRVGSQDWEEAIVIDPMNIIWHALDDYGSYIILGKEQEIVREIGVLPFRFRDYSCCNISKDKFFSNEYWLYFEPGAYELKAFYRKVKMFKPKVVKNIYSNVYVFNVNPYESKVTEVLQYLQANFNPLSLMDPLNNLPLEMQHPTYILENFEDTPYFNWAVFYLTFVDLVPKEKDLEEKIKRTIKEKLLQISNDSTNPFLQQRAKFLLDSY